MESLHLTIVRLVLHAKFANHGADGIGAIVSDFLVEDMPLDRACELSRLGSLALLELLWRRGLREAGSGLWSVVNLVHTEPQYRRWEFTQAMVAAVRQADCKMVQWLLAHFQGCPIYTEVLNEVVKSGQLPLMQLLDVDQRHGGVRWGELDLNAAARSGHWDMVRWVHARTPGVRHMSGRLVELAFEQNDLAQIKWLIANDYRVSIDSFPPYSATAWPICKANVRYLVQEERSKLHHGEADKIVRGALTQAAEVGDLEFVQWLAAQRLLLPEYVFPYALKKASEHGHLSVVQWLLTHRDQLGLHHGPSDAMLAAAASGQLELVQWLYQEYCCDPQVELFQKGSRQTEMDAAAENGHLHVLQYLHGIETSLREQRRLGMAHHSPLCTARALNAAAAAGHLHIVMWLHENRSEGCTTSAMDNAAANGHLQVVQWLHANRTEGCTTAALERVAAQAFHVATCPATHFSCCARKRPQAFENEQIKLLEWLNSNRSEGCTSSAMSLAAAVGNLKVLQWLHANTAAGCTTYGMDEAAASGRIDIIEWLHENRCEGCTSRAMNKAAQNGHLEVVKWLHGNRSEGCPAAAMDAAAGYVPFSSPRRQQLRIVQWLLSNSSEVSASSSFAKALGARHFEIMLLLHAHQPSFSESELRRLKERGNLDGIVATSSAAEICRWMEETYFASGDELME